MILAMNDIKALMELDYKTVFLGVFVLLFALKGAIMLFDWFCERFGIKTKKMQDHELLIKTSQNLALLQEKHEKDAIISDEHDSELKELITDFITETRTQMDKIAYDRINDREKSREIRADLAGSIKIIAEDNEKKGTQIDALINKQSEISKNLLAVIEKIDYMQKNTDERFAVSEEKENKRVQSEIKERIAQSYRYHHASNKITAMELEALEDLITTYEDHGGVNSFVHSVVQKEMYAWEVTETLN